MKMFLMILFVFLPLINCRAQNAPINSPATREDPKSADSRVWDFGSIQKNEVVRHDFEIKNDLTRALNIKGVSTSCGCTASSAGKNVLAPGESTQIKVEFNSKGYKGEAQQFVYVNTDDPDNSVLKFSIKAFVE